MRRLGWLFRRKRRVVLSLLVLLVAWAIGGTAIGVHELQKQSATDLKASAAHLAAAMACVGTAGISPTNLESLGGGGEVSSTPINLLNPFDTKAPPLPKPSMTVVWLTPVTSTQTHRFAACLRRHGMIYGGLGKCTNTVVAGRTTSFTCSVSSG
ncbi:MAG: hypothetical protein ACXVZW_04980 [Gaiellaceae bacterium]